MNNTVIIDLIGDFAINIGSNYSTKIRLCESPDLSEFIGFSQIRTSNISEDIVISPIVTILSKDLFEISIAFDSYPLGIKAGNYVYDVLFEKNDSTYRFYPISGKCQLIQRVTRVL